jgi:hypothetical protein
MTLCSSSPPLLSLTHGNNWFICCCYCIAFDLMDGILLNHIVLEEEVKHILLYNDKNSYEVKLMIAIYDILIFY